MRDDSGRLRGEGKLAQDLALGSELEIFLERTAGGAASSASLAEAWRSAGYGMVLTGVPGAGKSVQLLLLAEKLLIDAERNPRAGVPVIVSLPAWHPPGKRKASTGEDDRPFEEWLVAELQAKFRLPREKSRTWLEKGDLIPILDGLDETPAYHRQLVFKQIVNWVKDKERPPAAWALGCRDREYVELDPNYNRMGPRSTFWSIKAVSDEQRTRFLLNAAEGMTPAWQPVVDALERGEAPHLTVISESEQGVLATPLGLTIAVEAYQLHALEDSPKPTELLNPQGDWDRLWTRYVSHHYLRAHRDPDDAAEIRQPYAFDEARRWLATLASEEIGIGREIDVIRIKPPDKPAAWANFWSYIKDIEAIFFWYTIFSVLLFVAFGALIGWRHWGGAVGYAIVIVLAVISGWTLRVAGLPKYVRNADYKDIMRGGHQYVALGILGALPGLLILAAGSFRLGATLAWLISLPYLAVTKLINGLFGTHIRLSPNVGAMAGINGGITTGVAVAAMIAGLAWLTYACAEITRFISLYRKRTLLDRPHSRFFWWLDAADDPSDSHTQYERWISGRPREITGANASRYRDNRHRGPGRGSSDGHGVVGAGNLIRTGRSGTPAIWELPWSCWWCRLQEPVQSWA